MALLRTPMDLALGATAGTWGQDSSLRHVAVGGSNAAGFASDAGLEVSWRWLPGTALFEIQRNARQRPTLPIPLSAALFAHLRFFLQAVNRSNST